jgi:uncharacterized protein YndB with AHSA1/START domain
MTQSETDQVVAGVSDQAVLNATGKGWDQWFKVIDGFGGQEKTHPDIARYLAEEQGLSGWWSQMVTVAYEQARGLRIPHQKGDTFEISKSKTFAVPIGRLYKAWSDPEQRTRWLPDHPIQIRKATPEKSMRITWSDQETGLNVYFYNKGLSKSQVNVQHVKLSDPSQAEEKKAFWAAALKRLQAFLEPA